MGEHDTPTHAETVQNPLFDLDSVDNRAVAVIRREVARSRRALTDNQRRALIYKIGRRRVATGWVR
jgi:hypothetical protein